MPSVKDRVDKLEKVLEEYIRNVGNSQMQTEKELRGFDIIAVYETMVILVEVKSTPRLSYIDEFIAVLKELPEYFPEYSGRSVIPVFASLYLPDEVIAYLTKNGIYAMAIKEDMMDLINFESVKPKFCNEPQM